MSLATGYRQNAAFIFAVLLINSVIGAVQEWKAESSAEALSGAMKLKARVRRNGREQKVDSAELAANLLAFDEAVKWPRASAASRGRVQTA